MRICLTLTVVLSLVCVVPDARGDEPFVKPGQARNSALIYWQAFSMLPALSIEEAETLKAVEQGKKELDAADDLRGSAKTAIEVALTIRPEDPCEWGLVDRGMMTLLTHVSKSRVLARLLIIEARAHLEDGSEDKAIDCLNSAWLIARNIDEGFLVSLLVANSIEYSLLELAEAEVEDLSPAAKQRLHATLDKLPERTAVANTLTYEKEMSRKWFRQLVESDKKNVEVDVLGMSPDADPNVERLLKMSKAEKLKLIEEVSKAYDLQIAASKLPFETAAKKIEELQKANEDSSNPYVRNFLPSIGVAFRQYGTTSLRIDALKAALSK